MSILSLFKRKTLPTPSALERFNRAISSEQNIDSVAVETARKFARENVDRATAVTIRRAYNIARDKSAGYR